MDSEAQRVLEHELRELKLPAHAAQSVLPCDDKKGCAAVPEYTAITGERRQDVSCLRLSIYKDPEGNEKYSVFVEYPDGDLTHPKDEMTHNWSGYAIFIERV